MLSNMGIGRVRLCHLASLLGAALLGACEHEPRAETPAPQVAQRETAPQPSPPADTTSHAVAEQERQRLAALGYVGGAGEAHAGDARGVVLGADHGHLGTVFVSEVEGCRAQRIDRSGRPLARWRLSPCFRWEAADLLPDDSVVAVHRELAPDASETDAAGRALVRIAADGRVIFRTPAAVHHGLDASQPGRGILALAYHIRGDRPVHGRPVRDDDILVLDDAGHMLRRHSVLSLFERARGKLAHLDRGPDVDETPDGPDFDLLHTNAITWMRPVRPGPLYRPDNVLITVRNQNLVAIASPQQGILWRWGENELQHPHDATLLDNGHVLVFDNRPDGQQSRVVEVDPKTDTVAWDFEGRGDAAFHSVRRGSAQRLPNGDTLIASSGEGILLQVTQAGQLVWKYRNPEDGPSGGAAAYFRARAAD